MKKQINKKIIDFFSKNKEKKGIPEEKEGFKPKKSPLMIPSKTIKKIFEEGIGSINDEGLVESRFENDQI